jgi:dipeptidase D
VNDLSSLEPKLLWGYFLELSRIPRGSRNEAAASRWAAEQGRALGLEVEVDAVGNVLIRKRAAPGKQERPGVGLQAHLDMVCEKNEGTPHDFLRDPIEVVRDGDVVRARGTTLGADNGIGVAAALAMLATPDVSHPMLEVLLTVDEETGLTGANAVAPGWLRATRLLNLDSEDDRELTIGCAGGIDTTATRCVAFTAPVPGRRAMRLKVHGLKGGHSGVDIAACRGNALRLLGQILAELGRAHDLQLGGVWGGNMRNAIPREASAVLHVEREAEAALVADVERLACDWRSALGAFDPGMMLSLESAQAGAPLADRVLSPDDAKAVVGMLLAAPHGVEAMSPEIPGLVQTSTNLAVAETTERALEITLLTRSSIEASKAALVARIAAVAELAGFQVQNEADYPGWKPEPNAAIVQLVNGVHQELFGKPIKVTAMHAGLECGIIGPKYPGMEMVSIGPSMWDVHTPDERVSIASVQRFWRLLGAIVARA